MKLNSRLRQLFEMAALGLVMLLGLASGADAQFGEDPTNYVEVVNAFITVSYPDKADPDKNVTRTIPGVVTWQHLVHVRGGGWLAGSTMDIYLRGPLNTLGVDPIERGPFENRDTDIDQNGLWQVDVNGDFQGSFRLNYENRTNGGGTVPFDPDITQPGLYQIVAKRHGVVFPTAFDIAHSATFSLSPNTLFDSTTPHELRWPEMRGGRDGWLDSTFLATPDPEWTDPEWTTIWSTKPIGLYATVAATDEDGLNQAAHVAFHEFPASHFGHDWNLHLAPDPDYLWTLATANFAGEEGERGTERIELEWEGQNDGDPFVGSVGHGDIGMPAFAMATVGDRVYTVGRWVMDHGHPDEGVRSEIHPPRMIATMRKRHTVVPFGDSGRMTRAAQVDVFVSGHGGGINISNYDELERFLDNGGKGGARVVDFGLWTSQAGTAYFAFGPAPDYYSSLAPLLSAVGFVDSVPTIQYAAGPSAISTGLDGLPTPGPGLVQWAHSAEFQPVNDMDYEFDVPLPPRPAGATTPMVQVTKHSMDSTNVDEIITYSGNFAHVRLPYQGADNGIYARTLKFYWDAYSQPGDHYVVQIDDIEMARALDVSGNISGSQPLYLWADVCGQWRFLTGLFEPDNNPLLIPTTVPNLAPDHARLDGFQGARFDVYLHDPDTLRVFVGGYAQRGMDELYGKLYDLNAYDAGIAAALAQEFGGGDDQNLGGAVYDSDAGDAVDASPVKIPAQSSGVRGYFGGGIPDPVMKVTFSTTYVPRPSRILASDEELTFGTTCTGSSTSLPLQITNAPDAQSSLVINNFSIVGSGFSLVSPPALPLTLAPGESRNLTIQFSPTSSGAATGSLAIGSNDPAFPQLAVWLSGSVGSPTIAATANTSSTPTLAFSTRTRTGSTKTWPVTISNPGACTLRVRPSITGAGGTWKIVLPSTYYNPFTGQLIRDIVVAPGGVNTDLKVTFTPSLQTFKAVGTLTLTSNDPDNLATTLVFGAEGVPVGMRVLVVNGDGTPYPVVDRIKLKSYTAKVNSHLKEVPLTTIDPPESWQRIQFHYMTALDPAADGSDYTLEVKVGNNKQKLDFTLGPDEFRDLTVTLP